jgi:hypothetical protein
LQGLQVAAASEECDLVPGLLEPGTEVAAHAAGPHGGDLHDQYL